MKRMAEFEQFVKDHPTKKPGPPCSVCVLPPDILEVVHQAREKGHGNAVIARYLAVQGHAAIGRLRLHHHFAGLHHEIPKAQRQGR